MNTTMVTSAMDMLASKPASPSANKPTDNTEAPRFSEVLSKQHASQQTSPEQPKTTQPSTKEQEKTDGSLNQTQAKNDSDNPDSGNHLAPDDETDVAHGSIGLLLTENLLINTAVRIQGTDIAPQAAGLARTVDARLAPTAQEEKITGPALRLSTVTLAAREINTAATETTVAKQIGTVMASLVQPQAETRSTHQSTNDSKSKNSINKAILATDLTNNNKNSPDTIKNKVTEFSTAMVDSATLAQSRFAAKSGIDPVSHGLSDAAPPHTQPISSATLGLTGLATTLQGATATPLSNPQWANDFGRQVVNFTQNSTSGIQVAELRLDPPELGPIRITINLSDNVANAAFFSPHAIVRQTVENALPQLQQLLAQAGISLGEASVSDQGQAGNQSANESHSSGSGNRNNTTNGGSLAAGPSVTEPITPTRSRDPDALVDTFA